MNNTVIGASVEIEYSSVGNVRKALKEAKAELLAMQEQFGATSQEAINAAKKVADLKDRIEDAKETADLFDPGKKFQAFVTLGSQIASGFAAVQGAMALVGAESEDLQKAMLKVQGAMALAKGLSDLKDFGKSWQQLKIFVGDATKGLSGFKKALLGTGIGLFVVAIATLIEYWDDLKNAITGTNDVTRAYAEAQGEVSRKVSEATQKITEVTTALDLAKKGKISSTEALDIYNKSLGDTFGQAQSLAQAEQLIADNTAAYIKSIKLRTQAQVFYAKAAEASAKAASGEGVDPSFWQSIEDAVSGGMMFHTMMTERAKTTAENLKDLQDTEKTLTSEADKLMAEALETESKYKTKAKELNSKANTSKINSTKATNNEITKLEQQRLEAAKILEEARLSLLSEKNRELEELNKKRIEESKKLELAGIKDGSQKRLNFEESYRIQRQQIIDKYQKEEKNKEKEFQLTVNELTTRLQQDQNISEQEAARKAVVDKYAKEREELMKQYPNNLALLILLKQNEQAELAKIDADFAQKKIQEDAAKLLEQSSQEDLSFQERLAKIAEREQLESSLTFKSEEERTAFQKANSDARKAIILAESQFRIDQAQKVADVLGQFSDIVGKETAAGKVLAIASATINTYLAASKALTGIKSGNPLGAAIAIAQTAAVIATGIKTVREIARVKVPGGGGGGGSAPSAIATVAPLQPALSPAVEGQALNAEAINNLGNQASRAYVLNSDIQNNDQRNAYLERNARIG